MICLALSLLQISIPRPEEIFQKVQQLSHKAAVRRPRRMLNLGQQRRTTLSLNDGYNWIVRHHSSSFFASPHSAVNSHSFQRLKNGHLYSSRLRRRLRSCSSHLGRLVQLPSRRTRLPRRSQVMVLLQRGQQASHGVRPIPCHSGL